MNGTFMPWWQIKNPRPHRDESFRSRGTTLIGTVCPLREVRVHTSAAVTAGDSVQVYLRPG